MSESAPFITFHGIDGTGKTTAVTTTVEMLREEGIQAADYDELGIINPFSAAKKAVVAQASPSAQLAYFIGSTMYQGEQINSLTASGLSIVKGRYIDDVIAHHGHLGVSNSDNIAESFPIKQPDLRVVLTLEEEERRKRIEARGIHDEKDLQVVEEGSRLQYFQNTLLRIADKYAAQGTAIVINTANITPEGIATQAISNLRNRNLLPN